MEEQQLHVAIVPSPGMGHLIPFVELAKLLVTRFNFTISFLLPNIANQPTSEAELSLLSSLPNGISYTFLQPVDQAHLPDDDDIDVILSLALLNSVPSIKASLSSLACQGRVVAIVTDLFGTGLFEVGREMGIPPYLFFTTTAMYLSFLFHLPRLDETVTCAYQDMLEPVILPGCEPLYGEDFEEALLDRESEAYKWNLRHVKRYALAKGIFVNTFMDLESGAIHALQSENPNRPPIHPIGPIIRTNSGAHFRESECSSWLDQQPIGSVLYVSFGSGGTLSLEQLSELAIGLENSGKRFLWVVRNPNDESSSGSFFNRQHNEEHSYGFLPDGFADRTKDRGMLVLSWVPQVEVLSHAAIGGFLTHCGWNSVLESITNGIPLIAWPLYAEQKTNAVMLNQGLKVALRPTVNEHGLVVADEVAKVVNDLMEGDEGKTIRTRMEVLSNAAKKAIDEDGYSMKSLNMVALTWKLQET